MGCSPIISKDYNGFGTERGDDRGRALGFSMFIWIRGKLVVVLDGVDRGGLNSLPNVLILEDVDLFR